MFNKVIILKRRYFFTFRPRRIKFFFTIEATETTANTGMETTSFAANTTNDSPPTNPPLIDFESMSGVGEGGGGGGDIIDGDAMESDYANKKTGLTCYHQRSALLKSILNLFKKAIADSSNNNVPNLGDSIRHMM